MFRIHEGRRLISLLSSSTRLPKCWQLWKRLCKISPAQEGRPQDIDTEVPQQTACLITTVQAGSWTPRQFLAPTTNCEQATKDPWAAENRFLQRQRPKKSSRKKAIWRKQLMQGGKNLNTALISSKKQEITQVRQ